MSVTNGAPPSATGSFLASLPTMVVLNLVIAVAGFGVLWGVQTARMDEVRSHLLAIDSINEKLSDDRSKTNDRMITLEGDVKYISQTLAELKLRIK